MTKERLSRTDYTVCGCRDEKHLPAHHLTHTRRTRTTAALIADRIPGSHVIGHTITWTPWKRTT